MGSSVSLWPGSGMLRHPESSNSGKEAREAML